MLSTNPRALCRHARSLLHVDRFFFCDLHEVSEHVLGHVLLMNGDTRLPFCFSSRVDPSSSQCLDHSYRARERMKSIRFGVSRSMHTLLLCVTLWHFPSAFVIFTSSDIDFECNCHNTFCVDVVAHYDQLVCFRESSGGRKSTTDWIVEKMLELHSESHGRVDLASPDAPHQSQHIRIGRSRLECR